MKLFVSEGGPMKLTYENLYCRRQTRGVNPIFSRFDKKNSEKNKTSKQHNLKNVSNAVPTSDAIRANGADDAFQTMTKRAVLGSVKKPLA